MFLHIDIDSFFASAERSQNASLKHIPIAVGSRSNLEIFHKKRSCTKLMNSNSGAFVAPVFYSGRKKSFEEYFVDVANGKRKIRGIITTASYEARACGVKTAMPIAQALHLCPKMVVVPSNYPLYHTLSYRIHQYMKRHIPKVEQYSIDEFFGDVSGWVEDKEVYDFASVLQKEILKEFDIPVSIGIAKAKWIAKLATQSAKPYGVYEVRHIESYIENIPIQAFPGIGRGFQKRLEEHYIFTLGDLSRHKALLYSWKKPGIQLYHRVTGTDGEGICSKGARKSIGISRTFDPLYDVAEVKRRLMIMARHIVYMVVEIKVNPTAYYLKIGYEGGIRVKKYLTVDRVFSEVLFKNILSKMYDDMVICTKGAVKLTVNVSHFTLQHRKTLSLLDLECDIRYRRLGWQIHMLRERFGLDIIKTGNEL